MYVIKLKIKDEEDLYDPFAYEEELLSDDVKSYVIERLAKRDLGERAEIHIISPAPLNQGRIKRAFYTWIDEEEEAIKREFRRNMVQQLWLFAIGVAFIALSLLVESKVSVVWFTVLSTIGAFSMWEAASIWILQNPMLRLRRRVNRKIKNNGEIKFRCAKHAGTTQDSEGSGI